jgi:hypothetical protein
MLILMLISYLGLNLGLGRGGVNSVVTWRMFFGGSEEEVCW